MKRFLIIGIYILAVLTSCKKKSVQTTTSVLGQWQWVIQYANNPNSNSTPQSTGVQETLSFDANKLYSLTQNGAITNSGTYKTGVIKSAEGKDVQTIYFTNNRVTDSAAYFGTYGSDTLYFSTGLIGMYGSGARYYVKQ